MLLWSTFCLRYADAIDQAFWFLAVLIGLPFPLFWLVDVERGKREGAALSEEINGMDAIGRAAP